MPEELLLSHRQSEQGTHSWHSISPLNFLLWLFHRFNCIQPRNGERNNPQCNSIRSECDNDMWLWARERWSLFGEVVQGKERILPVHAEGNSVDKDFQVTWDTGRCKLMMLYFTFLFFHHSSHYLFCSHTFHFRTIFSYEVKVDRRSLLGGQQK